MYYLHSLSYYKRGDKILTLTQDQVELTDQLLLTADWRLELESPDFFAGSGSSFCGIGDTPNEALEDALNVVGESHDFDNEGVEWLLMTDIGTDWFNDVDLDEIAPEGEQWYAMVKLTEG